MDDFGGKVNNPIQERFSNVAILNIERNFVIDTKTILNTSVNTFFNRKEIVEAKFLRGNKEKRGLF